MSFSPIVIRELRVAARRSVTYRSRVMVAGAVGALAISILLYGSFASRPSRTGSILFQTMTWIALMFCLLDGVRKTADSLSEEKRDGTLGLLFLTDLKGYDVVFGKFTALSLGAIYGLVSLLPVLAVSILLGGVTMAEFWRLVLALGCIQFFSLCAGIMVSSFCRAQRRSVAGTILLIALFTGVPYLGGLTKCNFLSPLSAFFTGFDLTYVMSPSRFWWSLAITQFYSWFFLFFASMIAPRNWHDSPARPSSALELWLQSLRHRWRFGNARRREFARQAMLRENPVFWLAGRNLARRRLLWLVGGIGGAVLALFAISSRANILPVFLSYIPPVSQILTVGAFSQAWLALIWLLNYVLKVRLASQACHCLAEARRNQAIEMILTTPLTIQEIIHGQLLALRDTFLIPLIAILAVEFVGALSAATAQGGDDHTIELGMRIRGIGVVYFFMFLLDAAAVTWAGMWFGLSCKKESEAAAKTIFFVLVLPLVCLFFWPVGMLLMFVVPIFWICYSRAKLLKGFRSPVERQKFPLLKTSSTATR